MKGCFSSLIMLESAFPKHLTAPFCRTHNLAQFFFFLIIHSVAGYLSFFHFGEIVYKAAMSVLVLSRGYTCAYVSLRCTPGNGIAGT